MKFILFELVKGVIGLLLCIPLFTLIPLSTFILLLPLDLILWFVLRSKLSIYSWTSLFSLLWVAVMIFAFVWILNGNTGLEFVLDFDLWT